LPILPAEPKVLNDFGEVDPEGIRGLVQSEAKRLMAEEREATTRVSEQNALTAAANHLKSRRLENCTLYVSLEPCPMCAGAIVLSRIPTLVFGSYDPKAGACGTLFNIVEDKRLNHSPHVIAGVCDRESEALLKGFFGRVRSVPRSGGGQ